MNLLEMVLCKYEVDKLCTSPSVEVEQLVAWHDHDR